jgi:hypothetical protein
VTVIRTATNTISKVLALPGEPYLAITGIEITPNRQTAYLLNQVTEPTPAYGTLIPLRTATNALGKPIKVRPARARIAFIP